jgi:hypothetical protein
LLGENACLEGHAAQYILGSSTLELDYAALILLPKGYAVFLKRIFNLFVASCALEAERLHTAADFKRGRRNVSSTIWDVQPIHGISKNDYAGEWLVDGKHKA